ncbi:RIP metalloprotease RseP [Salipiger bermudensis]|uniref:RIP metalloprotease RseP n=1 Tax=Salipiger bermudensis TaxID=344736 RepID=UPI000C8E9A83|nr:RIP metalloprotease RseP [Salipiger bermudensis]MAE92670.1 RIP metalloprotease RseP [Pelagibaca sp.]MBN9674801.1 RIP metalloprotease RseP [Salipiger bermudensis]MCA1284676.1 RIP metalloprotease RseP [Salipiger bermudensis]
MDLAQLIPQFGGVIYTLVAFVVALSVIVAIHEYGHYIVGRWSGIDADVFSLGFGPVIYSRYDKRGTKWQIAALPFGGYVKFKGDANASGGADLDSLAHMSEAERRRTMNGAPLWARAATVAAGPVFNFALTILIFTGLFMVQGRVTEPFTVGDLRALPVAQELREGDEILAINGAPMPSFDDAEGFETFMQGLPHEPVLPYTVSRDGQQLEVDGPYVYPPLATQIVPRSAANEAGLEPGDIILNIDGEPAFAFEQLKEKVEGSEGAPLALTVWREGETLELEMTPKRTDEPLPEGGYHTVYRIGIVGGLAFEPATSMIGPVDAFLGGVERTGNIISGSLSGLWNMVIGNISSCNLSGPIGIAQTSGAMASQGGQSFITFIAVLSTAVGLLNLFPVPVLDGGHLVFHAWEAVTGKPPSDKALNVLMSIGLVLILSLMTFALTNDLFCP